MTGGRRRPSRALSAQSDEHVPGNGGAVYADGMRASTVEKGKFEILKQKALNYDIDPAGDYMRPGNNPAEKAFQLLRCGIEMLLAMTDDGFPSVDSRTRKRVPKYIRQALYFYGDAGALIFGQTVPLLYAKLDGRITGEEPSELTGDHHRHLYETVTSFYPYKKLGINVGEECLSEYRLMENHEVPQEVVDGAIPANEYTQALLNGENPDDDPRLVALQRDYARDFFIEKSTTLAIKNSLSPNDRKLLKNKFVRSRQLEEPAATEFRDRLRNAWIEGSQTYLEFARLDA
jgi:hypothetical protein